MPLILRNHKGMQPRNSGRSNMVRSAVDAVIPRAVQQYENSLAVDGFPILYYRRRTTGLRCTCCGGSEPTGIAATPENLEPGITVLDPEGNGTENYMQSMLHGSVFSIDRYGSRNRNVDANGGDNPQRSVPNSPLHRSKEIHPKSDDMDDPFAQQIEPSDPEDLFDLGIENNMAQATATTGCAICLGTGWVGGYDPSNALRVIYDAQAKWTGSLTINQTVFPHSWSLMGDKTVSVVVLLPAGAVGLEAFRVWNNREQISQVQAYLETPAGLLPFTQDLIAYCDGTYRRMVLRFGPDVEEFTHAEFQFEMDVAPIYAEWSKLSYNENLQVPENLDTPSLVISPSLPHVALYDIVTESVYRKLWKLTACTPTMDRNRQIHGWEAQARLLQTYELPNLLPRRQDRVWMWGNRVSVQPRPEASRNVYEPYSAARSTTPR